MRRLVLLLVPLCLLPLAACGGAEGPPPQQVVAAAPQATVDASTARLELVMDFRDVPGADGTKLVADGAVDFRRDRYALSMDLRDLVGGDADVSMEARQDGTTIYLRLPAVGDLLPGISPGDWMKLDLEALGDRAGIDIGSAMGLDGNDPREGLALLEGATDGGVRATGEEDLRGVATTRYRAEVDVTDALAGTGVGMDPDALRRFADGIGRDTLTITVWIDHDGLVRRLRLPLPLPEEAGGGTLAITTDYFDFGTPVDVGPPDAAHVVDMTERADELFPAGS